MTSINNKYSGITEEGKIAIRVDQGKREFELDYKKIDKIYVSKDHIILLTSREHCEQRNKTGSIKRELADFV